MIEASLKAGHYAAVSNEKATTRMGGFLLLFGSIFTFFAGMTIEYKAVDEKKALELLNTISYTLSKTKDDKSQEVACEKRETILSSPQAPPQAHLNKNDGADTSSESVAKLSPLINEEAEAKFSQPIESESVAQEDSNS
jgi:hypothetical protein